MQKGIRDRRDWVRRVRWVQALQGSKAAAGILAL